MYQWLGKKVLSYRFRDDAVRSLVGEILVRNYIIEYFKIQDEEIEISTNHFGNPELNTPLGIYFNLSHADEWVVCAIGSSLLGVDIEKVMPIDLSIADKYFSKVEVQQLYELPESYRLDRFYELWTLKESFVKAKGGGLSIPLNSFSFHIDESKNIKFNATNEKENYSFILLEIDPEYKYAICTQGIVSSYSGQTYQLSEWMWDNYVLNQSY